MDTSADVLQLIEESYKTFSKGQRYIADYIYTIIMIRQWI